MRTQHFTILNPRAFRRSCLAVLAAVACGPTGPQVQLLELPVVNLERAVTFYNGVFGWEVSRPDPFYAVLAASPVAIGLMLHDSVIPDGARVVIAVDDLELIARRILEFGGTIEESIAPSWRGRQVRFTDPDGNEVVVWSEAANDAAETS